MTFSLLHQQSSPSIFAWASAISPVRDSNSRSRHVSAHLKDNGTDDRQSTEVAVDATVEAHPSVFTTRRFWADFTLGFSDGLTVPFALTAGLSSLGRTDTVVYAGLAEVAAGCISMGIGGYLSARQAQKSSLPKATTDSSTVARYIAPLGLPAKLEDMVMAHVMERSNSAALFSQNVKTDEDDDVLPVISGLSVALGYLVGGFLPLGPYLFVTKVGDGLRWSVAVCIVALFLFGFIQGFFKDNTDNLSGEKMWKCIMGGFQMVILCGIAALAAVTCVCLFEGASR